MASNPPPEPAVDTWTRRLRETMAALIAATVILVTMILAVIALVYFTQDNDTFGRAKDILLFFNPFVGVVIGFYFNKVSTEARAESAEATARTANASAQQAVQERAEATVVATQATAQAQQAVSQVQEATAQAQLAQQEVAQVTAVLNDVSDKAAQMLEVTGRPAGGGVLGASGEAQMPPALADSRRQLEEALQRARLATRR